MQDHAASVYTGLIKIRKQAKGTDAFQTNRNLTLSEGAWAESVPNLDIETNDVRCSHASTVGPIDEEQRFYLESRGVPPEVAERLVVLGFFDEVLDQLPVGDRSPTSCARACRRQARPRRTSAVATSSGRRPWLTVVSALDDLAPGTARGSRSTASRSRWCASATTCTRSATPAATPTSRCREGEVWCDEARSSAGSTAARSA